MRWSLVLLAGAVAALSLACRSDSGGDIVTKTVEAFYEALQEDHPQAYTFLAQECKDQISYGQFAGSLFYLEDFFGDSELEIRDLEVIDRNDDAITADYQVVLLSDGEEIPLSQDKEGDGPTRFVREDGRWRFADCEDFGAPGAIEGSATAEAPPITPEFDRFAEAVAAEADDDPTLPGEYVDLPSIYGGYYGNDEGPNTGAHVNRQLDYSEQGLPPAGGPHWGSAACGDDPASAPPFCGPAPWGIYRQPWPAESLVHNMEHAGVVIWYNTSDERVIQELEAFAEEQLSDGKNLVLTPYPEMEGEHIAITVWSRIDKFPVSDYRRERLEDFLDKLYCRFDPESFC